VIIREGVGIVIGGERIGIGGGKGIGIGGVMGIGGAMGGGGGGGGSFRVSCLFNFAVSATN
jgi:hypothetical protein